MGYLCLTKEGRGAAPAFFRAFSRKTGAVAGFSKAVAEISKAVLGFSGPASGVTRPASGPAGGAGGRRGCKGRLNELNPPSFRCCHFVARRGARRAVQGPEARLCADRGRAVRGGRAHRGWPASRDSLAKSRKSAVLSSKCASLSRGARASEYRYSTLITKGNVGGGRSFSYLCRAFKRKNPLN